jgi:hypothetical protein
VSARVLLLVALAVALAPVALGAQESAPADTSLHRFLGQLSDSTDRYFGLVTAPVDTAGLDSALAAGLEKPWYGPRNRRRVSYGPVVGFQRVDGALFGASLGVQNRVGRWAVRGDLARTSRSHDWVGGGGFAIGKRLRDVTWRLRASGGRRTEGLDRDNSERRLASLKALLSGDDTRNYLRRDGYTVGIDADGAEWHAGLEFRDRLESPLPVTTLWNLFHQPPEVTGNLAATFGRTRELAFSAALRLPLLPLRAQVTQAFADRALGSDFDYRRTRVVVGGEITAFRHLSFVPQFAWGRLTGDPVPQASFYLGGPHTLRTLHTESLGGTGLAVARVDVIGADDLLALLHLPHPAMFPIQGGAFVATGAAWGADPFGGPGSRASGWPERNAWLSEAGLSLLYHPGVPDEDGYFRANYAWPLGPDGREARWTISYSRALDLLRPF